MKKVYLSGPISGLERADYMKRFAIAERVLRERGYKVCNPTRLAPCRWPWLYRLIGYRLTLLYDLWYLMHCDLIATLPGHDISRGANIERHTAYHYGLEPVPDDVHNAINAAVIDSTFFAAR